MYVLATQPQWQAQLRDDASRTADFVDEVLRYYAPVHFRVRVALADTELAGHAIRKGDRLHPMNAAANRDPRHYPDPNRIDPGRKPLRDHLAFHVGPRFCVGAALARAEGVEAVLGILERYDDFALDPTAAPPQYLGHMPRSHRPVNVVMHARDVALT